MDTSSIILLFVSASISFAAGRVIVHFRNVKRKRQALARQAQEKRDRPAEPEARNKAKRKRQLQEIDKANRKNSP
jgi:biopolymer transport protein ExbB/TolQ